MVLTTTDVLQAFLRDEFSAENAIFWEKCEQYRKLTDVAYRKQLARLIYVDHVAESGADQVNIDAYVRQSIERRLSTAPANLFDDAQRQVYLLMKYDPYQRFLHSRFHWDAVNAESLNNGVEVPATTDNVTGSNQVGSGSLLSRLRLRWKGVKASTKDDSGHGTSLSSLGSDGGGDPAEHSGRSGSMLEEAPASAAAAVTPASLFNRLLRRLSAAKSNRHRVGSESSTTAATASSSVPAARRSLFGRWRRSTDVEDDDNDDARSVSTVASTRTTVHSPQRRRRHRGHRSSSDGQHRRLSAPLSHVVRCDAEERRKFTAVMARLAAAAERDGQAPVDGIADGHRRRVDRQRLDVGGLLRSAMTNKVRAGHQRRRHNGTGSESTDTSVEFTVYFV